MKLLIVTQKVNADDPILGFFCRWIEEFAGHFEAVAVICLEEGRHALPANVTVMSLGKENGAARLSQLWRFYSYIWKLRRGYDAVFVHMNPIYVVLAGWFWKLSHKEVALWYTHKDVDLKLRIAVEQSDAVFTAAAESFTLSTPKKMVVGHGIDTSRYADLPRTKRMGIEPVSIVSVGRITPIKHCETLVEAARILNEGWDTKFRVTFVGTPATEADKGYADMVKGLVARYGLSDVVSFKGDVRPADMPACYAAADVTINLTPTGGIDKAVLESMAAGVPALASNEAFRGYFESAEKGLAGQLIFELGDAGDLAGKVIALFRAGGARSPEAVGRGLQRVARERADVKMLISTISDKLISWKSK